MLVFTRKVFGCPAKASLLGVQGLPGPWGLRLWWSRGDQLRGSAPGGGFALEVPGCRRRV